MYVFKKFITAIVLAVFFIIMLAGAAFVYLVVTPSGGKILIRCFLRESASIAVTSIGQYQGTLQKGFIFKDVEVRGLPYLPDALVRIQQARVEFPLWDWRHSYLNVLNARIFLPGCDTIVFNGEVSSQQIKGNLYAKSVDLHAVIRFWANDDIKRNLQGFISNVDVSLQGPVWAPMVRGHFLADDVRYRSILLTNGFGQLDLTLEPAADNFQLKGAVILHSGTVAVQRVHLELTKSYVYFQGDVFNPRIDIHVGSKVAGTNIHLAIKGTAAEPNLSVTSNPPLPSQQALQMLLTGNAWSSASALPLSGSTDKPMGK